MQKEYKYLLRENNIPYYYEDVISRGPIDLIMFELFDGKEVKWGVREDHVSIFDKKYCRSTPVFDNLVNDRYNCDKERIIYLKDKFVIHGKLNNSEVLCKINDSPYIDRHLVTIEDFGGKDVSISKVEDKKMLVSFKNNGMDKRLFFDCEEFKSYSNVFDATYASNCFLKSYQINDKTRVFTGMVNPKTGTVKENGYDINKKEFITFPRNEDGLIIEEEMIDSLMKEKTDLGINTKNYQELSKMNLITFLIDLGIDGFDVVNELFVLNGFRVKTK